jgi:hypothetical protein
VLRLKEHCVDINSSSALMGGQGLLAKVWHIGLQTNNTEISSYMIYQSHWKMCQWQSQHECDFIHAAPNVFNNTYHGGMR